MLSFRINPKSNFEGFGSVVLQIQVNSYGGCGIGSSCAVGWFSRGGRVSSGLCTVFSYNYNCNFNFLMTTTFQTLASKILKILK